MPPIKRIPTHPDAPRAGIDARQLAQRLGEVAVGGTVTHDELSALLDFDVTQRRDLIDTARALVQATSGKVFLAKNHVLTCLSDTGKVGLVETRLQAVYRHADKTQGISTTVEPARLTPLQRHTWLAQQSITAGLKIMTHPQTLAQVAAGAPLEALPFDLAAHADLFKTRLDQKR